MIISIGVDCGTADFLKKYNLRIFSLPFDWVVTYQGVSGIINNNFENYLPKDDNVLINKLNNACDVLFFHNSFPRDIDKMTRKIERLKNILETSNEKIIFIRKGHAVHHHHEQNGKYNIIKSDIIDAEDLDNILQKKYPNLDYSIIVVLVCGKCFDAEEIYKSESGRIQIYNMALPKADELKYENLCLKIFNLTSNV